jgi:hypothetical protein
MSTVQHPQPFVRLEPLCQRFFLDLDQFTVANIFEANAVSGYFVAWFNFCFFYLCLLSYILM